MNIEIRYKNLQKEIHVRKLIALAALVLSLALGAPLCAEEVHTNPAGNNVDQFTGKYWLQSSPENLEAYLYGLESAISVELFINNKMIENAKKRGRKPVSTLSPFEKGWVEAFTDVSRKQIVEQVTAWYKEHPDQENVPVLDVIWNQLIMPRLDEKK